MLSILYRLLAFALFFCLVAAPAGATKLTVVGARACAPLEFAAASGEARGICVDVWKLWSKKTGIEIEYKLMDWAEAQKAVLTGEADAVGGMFFSRERRQRFDLVSPYMEVDTYAYFHQSISGIKGASDLTGFRVGMVKGDRAVSYFREKDLDIAFKYYPSYGDMVESALAGEVKIFVCGAPMASYYLAKHQKGTSFLRTAEPLMRNRLYAAIAKGNPGLEKRIRRGFSKISASDINSIRDKWLGVPWSRNLPWQKLMWAALGAAAILAAVIFWNILLRKKIAAATRELEENNKELLRTKQRYAALITQTETAYAIFDSRGVLKEANKEFIRLTGHKYLREIRQEPLKTWISEHDKQRIQSLFESIRPGMVEHHVEFAFSPKDSGQIQVLGNMAGVESDNGHLVMLLCGDITERKLQEKARLKIDKLESIGILAGGIAHDFNNILSALSTNISLAQRNTTGDTKLSDLLTKMEQSVHRAQGLTSRLLTFSRGGEPVKKAVSFQEILEETLNFLRFEQEFKIKRQIPKNLYWLQADPGQLAQVFQNLLINSAQAMPAGGEIFIQAENRDTSAGPYVQIFFEDSGEGISPKDLEKIFDPYFTTKEEGSGLGLSSVHSIIRKHGGEIRADSRPGRGTSFSILLPARTNPARESGGKKEQEKKPGTRTILVMDDEKMILEVAEASLKELGYTPLVAGDGEEAARIYLSRLKKGKPPDAVITDLRVAGGMDGRETAEEIMHMHPEAKIIVSSGYSNDPVMSDYRAYGFQGVLKKPYTLQDLKNILEKTLDK